MLDRLLRIVAALFQGAVFVVLTPLTGALLGAVVAHLVDGSHVMTGARIGAGVGGLFALSGFSLAVSAPVGPWAFLFFWLREMLGPLLAVAASVYSAFSLSCVEPTWLGSAAIVFIQPPISAGFISASNFFSMSDAGGAACVSAGEAMSPAARTNAESEMDRRMVGPSTLEPPASAFPHVPASLDPAGCDISEAGAPA